MWSVKYRFNSSLQCVDDNDRELAMSRLLVLCQGISKMISFIVNVVEKLTSLLQFVCCYR